MSKHTPKETIDALILINNWFHHRTEQIIRSDDFDKAITLSTGFIGQHEALKAKEKLLNQFIVSSGKLLDAYGEAHAIHDLGDCDGSIEIRELISKAEQLGGE